MKYILLHAPGGIILGAIAALLAIFIAREVAQHTPKEHSKHIPGGIEITWTK